MSHLLKKSLIENFIFCAVYVGQGLADISIDELCSAKNNLVTFGYICWINH